MIKLNLKAESPELQAIKEFLEQNANEFLAKKINNGVYIQKDGKRLLNKKDLTSFMKYACEEAKELSAKGATSACVKDDVVFGWAMHYFEENDIIGTLYNEDGSEYKPASKKSNPSVQRIPAPIVSAKPTFPKPQQFNLFDMMAQAETPTADEPTELNVDRETGEILPPKPIEKKEFSLQASPLYQKYMHFQNQYPQSVIAYKVGDFFEVFGESAVKISNVFDLTLTGRDCGLDERVPMIGFPYHASDIYFHKIAERFDLVVVEDNIATPYEITGKEENEPTMYENTDILDKDLQEMRSSAKAFEQAALCRLLENFDDEIVIPTEDY